MKLKRGDARATVRQKLLDLRTLGSRLGIKPSSARVAAVRMVRRNELLRVRRNMYLPADQTLQLFELANALQRPSYVSFESALNRWGVIAQVPQVVTSAAKRSRRIIVSGTEFMYRQMPSRLLSFGYMDDGGAYVATPEKALLDSLYMKTKGIQELDPGDVASRKLNRKLLTKFLDRFPKSVMGRIRDQLKLLDDSYVGVR